MTPTNTNDEQMSVRHSVISRAIDELTRLSDDVRYCHTVDGEWDGTESQAKEEYDRLLSIARELTSLSQPASEPVEYQSRSKWQPNWSETTKDFYDKVASGASSNYEVRRLYDHAAPRINEGSGQATLGRICGETYQVVGVLARECGRFGDPAVTKVLDNLSALALVHEDVLPFPSAAPPAAVGEVAADLAQEVADKLDAALRERAS